MGLDMYVYKADSPALDPNIPYSYKEISGLGYSVIEDDVFGDDDTIALKKFAVPFDIIFEEINHDKIIKEYGFSGEIHPTTHSSLGSTYTDGTQTVVISADDLKNKFTVEVQRKAWVIQLTEVMYWRKEYGLQNMIHESFLEEQKIVVDNCGYYPLSMQQVAMICKEDKEAKIYQYEDGTLFYHEWY